MNVKDAARESSTRAGYNPNIAADAVGQAVYETAFIAGAEWADAHPKNPWISVKDRLPEEGQMVFALTQREGIFYIHQETFYRAKYLDGYGKWIHGNSRVLAWMPIPSFDEILEANKDVLQRIKGNGD